MMRIALSIVAGCLLFGTASADRRIVEQLERSYELLLGDVTLPGGEAGTVIFTPCETCARETLRVNGDTRYLLNGVDLSLADLKLRVDGIRGNGGAANTGVYIHYDIKTTQVNRVRVVEFSRAH